MSQRHVPLCVLIIFGACNTNSCNILSLQHVARSPTSWNKCNMSQGQNCCKIVPATCPISVNNTWFCRCYMLLQHVPASCPHVIGDLYKVGTHQATSRSVCTASKVAATRRLFGAHAANLEEGESKLVFQFNSWRSLIGQFIFCRSDLSEKCTHAAITLLSLILSLRSVEEVKLVWIRATDHSDKILPRRQRLSQKMHHVTRVNMPQQLVPATCCSDLSPSVSRPLGSRCLLSESPHRNKTKETRQEQPKRTRTDLLPKLSKQKLQQILAERRSTAT